MLDDRALRIIELLRDHNNLAESTAGVEDPSQYILQKDLAEDLGISAPAISGRVKKLKDQGLVAEDPEKTKNRKGLAQPRAKVLIATVKGLRYLKDQKPDSPGPVKVKSKVKHSQEGPKQKTRLENNNIRSSEEIDSYLDNVEAETMDLHGGCYRYRVYKIPKSDPWDWRIDKDSLNNTEIRRREIEGPMGKQKALFELFIGKNRKTLLLKPTVTGELEDLGRRYERLAWYWYDNMQKAGYRLSRPEQVGDDKISLSLPGISEKITTRVQTQIGTFDGTPAKGTFHPEEYIYAKALTDRVGFLVENRSILQANSEQITDLKKELSSLESTLNNFVSELNDIVKGSSPERPDDLSQPEPGDNIYR